MPSIAMLNSLTIESLTPSAKEYVQTDSKQFDGFTMTGAIKFSWVKTLSHLRQKKLLLIEGPVIDKIG